MYYDIQCDTNILINRGSFGYVNCIKKEANM